jgi:hypothetical protein
VNSNGSFKGKFRKLFYFFHFRTYALLVFGDLEIWRF